MHQDLCEVSDLPLCFDICHDNVSRMSPNTYMRACWLHDLEDEPVELWSELDGERFETRKLEIFRDGRTGFASATEATEGTRLGETAVPPLDEIAQDRAFVAEEVSQEAFELRWRARAAR